MKRVINVTVGFVIGMLGWFYILYEIFAGEAAKMAADQAPEAVQRLRHYADGCHNRLGDLPTRLCPRLPWRR